MKYMLGISVSDSDGPVTNSFKSKGTAGKESFKKISLKWLSS